MKQLRLGLVALVAVALTAPSASAATSRCRTSSMSGGAKAFAKTRHAVLFTKRHSYYGCLYSGQIHPLWDEGGGIYTKDAVLAGRFAAYGTVGSALGDDFDRIVVFDLGTGKVTFEAPAVSLSDIVLKRNGSVGLDPVQPGALGHRAAALRGAPVFPRLTARATCCSHAVAPSTRRRSR